MGPVIHSGLARSAVGDAQHGPCFLATQDQVRLVHQSADVGARVVAGQRLIHVSEQGRPVFRRDAGSAQPTPEGIPLVPQSE